MFYGDTKIESVLMKVLHNKILLHVYGLTDTYLLVLNCHTLLYTEFIVCCKSTTVGTYHYWLLNALHTWTDKASHCWTVISLPWYKCLALRIYPINPFIDYRKSLVVHYIYCSPCLTCSKNWGWNFKNFRITLLYCSLE